MEANLLTGHSGKPHVYGADIADFFQATIGDGRYILDTRQKCRLEVTNANTLTLMAGIVLWDGRPVAVNHGKLTISNGRQGKSRYDLIGLQFKRASGIETVEVKILEGESVVGTPSLPKHEHPNLTAQTSSAFLPLYKIRIDGLNVRQPEMLISIGKPGGTMDFNAIYPVGSVYISFNSTNPSTLFGGSWTRLEDRFLLGASNSGQIGGEKTHKLTIEEIPYHKHNTDYYVETPSGDRNAPSTFSTTGYSSYGNKGKKFDMGGAGSGRDHNNMPPYITCFMWRRTA